MAYRETGQYHYMLVQWLKMQSGSSRWADKNSWR